MHVQPLLVVASEEHRSMEYHRCVLDERIWAEAISSVLRTVHLHGTLQILNYR